MARSARLEIAQAGCLRLANTTDQLAFARLDNHAFPHRESYVAHPRPFCRSCYMVCCCPPARENRAAPWALARDH
eukprot:737562-Pyramimonas_sp.AAC.1